MGLFESITILAAFLCSLVAGLLFVFAVIVMPGLSELDDRAYLRAFQVIDGVIQRNHPLFIVVWLGSVAAILIAAILGIGGWLGAELDDAGRALLIAATAIYLLGVQLPTIAINVPLNNRLQTLDVHDLDEAGLKQARDRFEPRWTRSNWFRTVAASLTSILLLVTLTSL
jgi:uncharacterized membrane protein